MAWEPQQTEHQREFGLPSASSVLAQESANAFMAKVYRWMVGGVAITAATGWYIAQSQSAFSMVMSWYLPLVLLQLGAVFALSFLAHRLPAAAAGALFFAYSFLTGLTLSAIFFRYRLDSIATSFGITAAMFGAMSVYATVTKKDLSGWGTFLFMGLIGVLLAGIINIFVQSDLLGFVKSCAAVVVFAGLTAYDTQKLRQMHASSGYASAGSLAINGALMLYLDFINLFLNILRLFGSRR
ncbi:MAG: Bax inhibitor-1/YccA family protein [Myxococcaceae bacterium]|nr:Bax inhibitor-1/YccA family protein [Myxococcaceae bacterium]